VDLYSALSWLHL